MVNWTSPVEDPDNELEKVTETGKSDAAALGAIFAQKYSNILSTQGEDSWKIWTAAATRDQVSSAPSIFATSLIPDNFPQDTSRAFVAGFNQSMVNATLVIVDEGESQFANTLTPHVSIPLVLMTWD